MQQGVKHTIKTNGSYYMTLTVVDWADVFTRKSHKQAIIASLRYCIENKGLNVYAYCLMTNHLHLIANCEEPFQLSDTIRDFKRHSARKILDQIVKEPESRRENLVSIFKNAADNSSKSKAFKFWKTGNHAIELYTEKFLWYKINYIHNNPVVENFVVKPPLPLVSN
ncbi:transposase [Ulvibacterium marinum]|uniref:transposase n=1 Tax=Ulvibacterium marinum TaxID=2419782 RepID=UPI002494A798|nr:transposase [Ulvibacterium marinum]